MPRTPIIATLAFIFAFPTLALAADPNAGFTARGTLVAQTVFSGTRINLGGNIALASRGQALRADITNLGIPGSDPTLNALLQQFLPAGGVSVLIDQSQNSTIVWSDAKRKFYQFPSSAPAAGGAAATGITAAGAGAAGSIVQALESGRFFQNYSTFSESVNMTGHGNVNGHQSTLVHFAYNAQRKGKAAESIDGDLALADDQQELPVRISAATKGSMTGSFRMDFTSVSAVAPDPGMFSVPSGYAKANDPSEIFGVGSLGH